MLNLRDGPERLSPGRNPSRLAAFLSLSGCRRPPHLANFGPAPVPRPTVAGMEQRRAFLSVQGHSKHATQSQAGQK